MRTTHQIAKEVRRHALYMVHRAKASHIGSALSIADILAVLYEKIIHLGPSQLCFNERERFILSKGHACVAVYAVLAEMGLYAEEKLLTYGEDFSWFMNHISHKVPGVEFSTGALGHGLPFGVGKALFSKVRGKNWSTYVLLGDGEMDEGSNWEALMFASHNKLQNLVAIIDCNNLQSLTTTSATLEIEPLRDKLESFGCFVTEIDGHDHDQILSALQTKCIEKPHAIIARTIKGKGVSFMENKVEWHYKNPTDEELEMALIELEKTN
jgi:transketolase